MRDQLGVMVVVLVNDSVYETDYLELGCHVVKLKHPIYSRKLLAYFYNKAFSLLRRISSRLALYFQVLFEYHFALRLCELIKRYHIDILHLNNQPMRNFSGFIAARSQHVKLVCHIRTLNIYGCTMCFSRYMEKASPVYVPISHAVNKIWKQFNIVGEVLYNPVPVNRVLDGSQEKKYDLIYVGRLVSGKGIESLIEAIGSLNFSVNLALLGDGELRDSLIVAVKRLKLENQVTFLGYCSDPLEYISKARILVLPTENEGMGRVIIEAMKLHVPVIANGVGGVTELVRHDETGILYDKTPCHGLSSSIVTLLNSPVLQQKYASAAYEFACRNFSAETYRKIFSEVYVQVCA